MAKRQSTTAKYTQSVPIQPYSGVESAPGLNDALNTLYTGTKNDINTGSFRARHPVASKFTDAAAGGLMFGPAGVVGYPFLGARDENRRTSSLGTAYQEAVKNLIENQKNIDAVAQPRNDAMLEQARMDEAKRQGLIQSTVPDLYPRSLPGMDGAPAPTPKVPIYSKEALEANRKGTFGSSDINYLTGASQAVQRNAYGQPASVASTLPGQGGTISTGISQYQPAEVPKAPFFVSDPQTIMQQLTSAQNKGLEEGQQRFQFDAEAPKREADLKQTLLTAQNLILTGQKTKAETLLKQAEAKWYGKKTQSEINRNNYHPAPTPNVLNDMTPEQRRQNAARVAAGASTYGSSDALAEVQLQNIISSEKDANGNQIPPELKAAAAQALRRLRSQNGGAPPPNPGVPPAPGKGKHTTLPSGRKVVIQ